MIPQIFMTEIKHCPAQINITMSTAMVYTQNSLEIFMCNAVATM